MRALLIIFVKNPTMGKVKSRLAARIGDAKALAVYRRLLAKTKIVVSATPFDKLVCYNKEVDQDDLWNNGDFQKDLQEGDDLGKKMYHAIARASEAGYDKICLIGSDNMEITPEIIMEAYKRLDVADIVLGPSRDGGYYLVGMKKPYKEIFNISRWSTSLVLDETISKAKELNLKYELLTELNDVDELEDIRDQDRDFLLS